MPTTKKNVESKKPDPTPAKPATDVETRLYQTGNNPATDKEWLTKEQARKYGFYWSDEEKD